MKDIKITAEDDDDYVFISGHVSNYKGGSAIYLRLLEPDLSASEAKQVGEWLIKASKEVRK